MIEKITKIELEEKMTKIICSDSASFFFQSDNKSSSFFLSTFLGSLVLMRGTINFFELGNGWDRSK